MTLRAIDKTQLSRLFNLRVSLGTQVPFKTGHPNGELYFLDNKKRHKCCFHQYAYTWNIFFLDWVVNPYTEASNRKVWILRKRLGLSQRRWACHGESLASLRETWASQREARPLKIILAFESLSRIPALLDCLQLSLEMKAFIFLKNLTRSLFPLLLYQILMSG